MSGRAELSAFVLTADPAICTDGDRLREQPQSDKIAGASSGLSLTLQRRADPVAFADSGGARVFYDDRGSGEPVLLCLPGLWLDHSMFVPLAECLSERHRVLAVDWRGYGKSQASGGDFGFAEMLTDVLAVIRSSGARSVIPVAQAHAGWVAVALRQRLGDRVPKIVCVNWNPIFTSGNPLAAVFLGAMEALQDRARWRDAAEQLLTMWLTDAPASVTTLVRTEMESLGFDDWARAARAIVTAYARDGEPLQALSRLNPPPPALHVYGHPPAPDYLSVQESFAWEHPWFAVQRLAAVSHFPTLEVPDETARVISEFID
jgi:pimeloyl-ACP methyl ester carboxylesterase